jgi:hypothetical protein
MLHVAEVQEAAVDDARKSAANVQSHEAAAADTHAALMLLRCLQDAKAVAAER